MDDLIGIPGQIAVMGETAGAKLATKEVVMARDARITQTLHQLFVCPVAQIDLLRSEGANYAAALIETGVSVETRTHDGVTNEFFDLGAVAPRAVESIKFATARLRQAFHAG